MGLKPREQTWGVAAGARRGGSCKRAPNEQASELAKQKHTGAGSGSTSPRRQLFQALSSLPQPHARARRKRREGGGKVGGGAARRASMLPGGGGRICRSAARGPRR